MRLPFHHYSVCFSVASGPVIRLVFTASWMLAAYQLGRVRDSYPHSSSRNFVRANLRLTGLEPATSRFARALYQLMLQTNDPTHFFLLPTELDCEGRPATVDVGTGYAEVVVDLLDLSDHLALEVFSDGGSEEEEED